MLSLKPSPSRIALVKNVKMWGFEAFLTYFSRKSTDFGDFVELLPLEWIFENYVSQDRLARRSFQLIMGTQNVAETFTVACGFKNSWCDHWVLCSCRPRIWKRLQNDHQNDGCFWNGFILISLFSIIFMWKLCVCLASGSLLSRFQNTFL